MVHVLIMESLPRIGYQRSGLRIELCVYRYIPSARAPVARLVRVSDQHSEDPGSNPDWISMSFFILHILIHPHSYTFTHTPLTYPHTHPHMPSHTLTHTLTHPHTLTHTLIHPHTSSHTLTHPHSHPHSHTPHTHYRTKS